MQGGGEYGGCMGDAGTIFCRGLTAVEEAEGKSRVEGEGGGRRQRQQRQQFSTATQPAVVFVGPKVGKVSLVLSHSQDGQTLYEFDSRSNLSMKQHSFAALAIVHNLRFGSYKGGAGNTNDVVL